MIQGGCIMNRSKALKVTIVLLLALVILIICGRAIMRFRNNAPTLYEIIQNGNVSDLTLTIYYTSPFLDTRMPFSLDWFTYRGYREKVVISGDKLKEHIDILYQISTVDLIPVENKTFLDARMYYVFETENDGKIFSVAMWGLIDSEDYTMFVNGVQVMVDDIFYEVLMMFLPEHAAGVLTEYLRLLRL